MNNVNLIGRLTKDVELRNTGKIDVANFTLAVDKIVNGNKSADFINCVAFDKQADNLSKYCSKGSQIGLTGRIQTSSYQDKNGNKIFKTDVLANTIIFLDHKNNETTDNVIQTESKSVENDAVIDDTDLPF
jgi:single-strand DNA-binding protein